MFNSLSPNDAVCPVGFKEREINSAAKVLNIPKNINNINHYNNNNNNNINFNSLTKQLYILYGMIGFLFMISLFTAYQICHFKKTNIKYQSVDNQL